MAWQKTTSNYVANWQMFRITFSSLAQLAAVSLLIGLLWGVLVVKIHGLPGDPHRDIEKNWKAGRAEDERLTKEICRDFPHSGVCKKSDKQPIKPENLRK